MNNQPNAQLYRIAKDGASTKWNEADALIDLALDGHSISHLEIAEVQKCATILDDFARQIYNDPAMWNEPATKAYLQARCEMLEKELADPISKERADAIIDELTEIEA